DVSKNTQLTELWCSYNQLTTLDVSNNTQLTTLYCNNTQLTTLDVSINTQLTTLWCDDNPGKDNKFIVKAWFDSSNIPTENFTTGSWNYDGSTITIEYQKAE
ncbi:MAG: leucine-rich repeat domain-containing protein, partial [Muribaculaceae bacterium]|nr:leucine-rich repeat domain-containing protein [Muribaculaceae bacterium]